MVNAAGFRAKREENGCFNNIYREFNDRQRRMRPDLSIFDLPGPNRKIILDISNICPIPIFGTQQYSRNDALIIIFETTGRVRTESFCFLQSILRNISGYMDGKLLL